MRLPPPLVRYLRLAAASLAVLVFLWLVGRFCDPVFGFTSFLQLDSAHQSQAIAEFRAYPVFVYPGVAPYDGLQYSQIAYHPLLRSPELATAIDNLPYRAQRILLPAAAWLLAAGQPAWIAQVYAVLNILCWIAMSALLWRILPVNDARGFIAWVGLLFSAGALSSVRFALVDLPALVLLAAAVWNAERARTRSAIGWLAAAALTRETSLLAAPGLVGRHPESRATLLRNSSWILLAAAPLALWLVYIRWRVGPLNHGIGNFAWPAVGFVGSWRHCLAALQSSDPPVFAWSSLLALVGLTAQAAFVLARPRLADAWWRVGAAYSLLLLLLGPAVWEGFPVAASRVLLPLNLACNVLAQRTRAPLAWLLACNLTVVAGLVAFKDIPTYQDAVALFRSGRTAAVVKVGAGWFGPEQDSHSRWHWAGSRGRLDIFAWPPSSRVQTGLVLKLRSMTPCIVRARAGDREIWRGPVAPALTIVRLPPLQVTGGHLELELESDSPPLLENATPSARRLSFALYDPVVSASEIPSSSQ